MNIKKLSQWTIILIVIMLLSVGCRALSLFQPAGTTTPILPTDTNLPAGAKPPVAGEWVATTDFGKLVFTVDATGTKITKMSYQFSKWTCGPGTTSGTIEVGSEWPITNGKFSVTTSFDAENKQTMNFGGTYDAASQKFSGIWDEVSHGTKCSGTWEAYAPK
jgi:hypothetical protein